MITVTVDPFHVVAAVTDVVASGSYTGNAATNRTIPLAFTPKWVIVVCETASSPMFISHVTSGTWGWVVDHTASPAMDNTNLNRPGLTTNGFIVSGNFADVTNTNSAVFHYFAFG